MADFTPVDTFTSPVPALSDGQPANAAVLNAPHQALVNRTHWLKETIDSAGITRDGATRIREVADEAALKAITGMQDGELAITANNGLVFRYHASAGGAEIARWIVTPASGTGRWLNTAFSLLGGPTGLVVADPNERIPAALPKNGVVALVTGEHTGSRTVTSGTYVPLDDYEVTVPAIAVGDIVEVTAETMFDMTAGSEWWSWNLRWKADGSAESIAEHTIAKAPISGRTVTARSFGRFTAAKAGEHRIASYVLLGSSSWSLSVAGMTYHVTVYRP